MEYLPYFWWGGQIPRVWFLPANKLPCTDKTVSVDAIKHAFIINMTDYSSAHVVYLLILDPEDKPGSSPDIKKYDYLITGHNVGEIPQERIRLHWLIWLTVLYLGKYDWQFSVWWQRTAEGSETRKQIKHWNVVGHQPQPQYTWAKQWSSTAMKMLSFLR